jgi:hypothetical protein
MKWYNLLPRPKIARAIHLQSTPVEIRINRKALLLRCRALTRMPCRALRRASCLMYDQEGSLCLQHGKKQKLSLRERWISIEFICWLSSLWVHVGQRGPRGMWKVADEARFLLSYLESCMGSIPNTKSLMSIVCFSALAAWQSMGSLRWIYRRWVRCSKSWCSCRCSLAPWYVTNNWIWHVGEADRR